MQKRISKPRKKQKGGAFPMGSVSKMRTADGNEDITAGILATLAKNERLADKTVRFETSDGKTFTVQFNPALENEGQFNKGVGTVIEHPEWFARIHEVESDNATEIESGFLLHELSPVYFIQYHGIYSITGRFYLQVMDKIDYTLFKYIIHYLQQSPDRTNLPKIVNELCPMIYSLMFQKVVVQEMKYRRFQERYIDFKADNIGLVATPSDATQPKVVAFEGLGVKLPIQFELLGMPTTIRMKLFDQQLVMKTRVDDNAFLYELIKEYVWAPYGRTAPPSKQYNLQGFRTDTLKKEERDSYHGLIRAAECSHEKAYEAIVETLVLGEDSERYTEIYRVIMNLLADSTMFPFPEKDRVEKTLPGGLSLYDASLIYENDLVFSPEFYSRIITGKGKAHDEDLRGYIRSFRVNTIKMHYTRVVSPILSATPLLKLFHTEYDDGLRLKLQHCVYLNDDDMNRLIEMLRASVGTIVAFFNSDASRILKQQNDTYEWIVPEFARIYTEQWITVYRTWRGLVRQYFILGEPKGNGKINLLELKKEEWRFDAVFRDLVRIAGVDASAGGTPAIVVGMPAFVAPAKEVSMTLEAFLKMF